VREHIAQLWSAELTAALPAPRPKSNGKPGLVTQLQKLVLRYGSSKLAMLESGNKLPHSKRRRRRQLEFHGVPATAEFSDHSKTHSFHGRDHPEASSLSNPGAMKERPRKMGRAGLRQTPTGQGPCKGDGSPGGSPSRFFHSSPGANSLTAPVFPASAM
jgi:hypothetical protein